MKKIISLALLSFLLIGSGTAMAQNKKAPKSSSNAKETQDKKSLAKKDAADTKPDEKQQYFYGTIRYNVVGSKLAMRRNTEPMTTKNLNEAVSINSKQMKVDDSKLKGAAPEEMKVLYFFTKEGTYAYFERFGLASTLESGTLFFVYADPENPSVAKSNEKEKLELRDAPKSYYVRTRDTKEIAGCKAVRYECRLPQMKGNIWVDERRVLYVENVPFYGMMHPVLEFDLRVVVEDKEVATYHLVASEIMPEKIEDHMIDRIMNGDHMEMPEVIERFRDVMGL